MRGARMLHRGRKLADDLMASQVRIRRKTGEHRDAETGKLVPTWADVYVGVARIRMGSYAKPREGDQAGSRFVETSPTLSLPIGDAEAAQVRLDDEAEVIGNELDPLLVGTVLRIVQPVEQTYSTARRFTVEVVDHTEVPHE